MGRKGKSSVGSTSDGWNRKSLDKDNKAGRSSFHPLAKTPIKSDSSEPISLAPSHPFARVSVACKKEKGCELC